MKKRILLIALLLSVFVLAFVCCDRLPDATAAVRSPYDKQTLTISAEEVKNYDFTRYFSLTGEDGTRYPVLPEYLDLSHFSETEGGYVLCVYKDSTARLNVNVSRISYELFLDTSSVTVPTLKAADYDYLSHFYATIDGESTNITKSMTESTVKPQDGDYYFRVDFHGVVKTLNVYVRDEITIEAREKSIQLDDSQIYTFDFTSLFDITVNGKATPTTTADIDISEIQGGNSGTVYCTKGTQTAYVDVIIVRNMYQLDLTVEEITLHTSQVEGYNYLALFKATKNGQPFALNVNMVSSNVKALKGTYSYTVTVLNVSKTLKVTVTDVHQVEIIANYSDYKLQIGKRDSFDYTTLFSLYVDGKAREITDAMVNSSAAKGNVNVGDRCEIILTYDNDGTDVISKTSVIIVEDVAVRIETHDIVTYPNSKPIDLTTLFTVYEGDKQIPVTSSMLTVPSNYPIIGVNTITLNYGGVVKTATVTVKRGVIINTIADKITVLKGTNKQNYFFQDDFEVIVNGIVLDNILPYLDISNVDFNTEGAYTVKISVPYNDKAITGVSGSANLTYYEETIIYKVVSNTYTLALKQDTVQIHVGDKFNIGNNINLTINGYTQSLTTNPDLVNILNCYAKIIKDVNSATFGLQRVIIDLYINGTEDPEPVRVEYDVEVLSDAQITVYDKVIFTESTLYTKDLFSVTRNGNNIPVTQDMVSGYVNTFKTGLYQVELSFEGITRTATVVVLDNSLVGEYITPLHSVAVGAEYDDDGDKYQDEQPATQYGPMVISSDGGIIIDGRKATIYSVIDENTLCINFGGFNYNAYIADGIITLVPINEHHLSFSNIKRPMAYFKSDIWAINRNNNHFVINNGKSYNHIIETDSMGYYTVEVLRVYNKNTFENLTYAIKILQTYHLVGDVVYEVTFGAATLNDGFKQGVFESGTMTFDGGRYNFTFGTDVNIALIDDEQAVNPYLGITFTNGSSTLAINADGGITYSPLNGPIIRINTVSLTKTKNIVYDFVNNTVLIYEIDAPQVSSQDWYSYKFVLNLDNKTFTVVEKDKLYGLYLDDNNKYYIFLDGYGGGHVSTDLTSYSVTPLTYTQYGNEVELNFEQMAPKFLFGPNMTLYIAEMYNILTCKVCSNSSIEGIEFINKHISYGAVIRFDATIWRRLANSNKDELYGLITIITKDGEMSLEQKKDAVNLRAVDTNQNGVYQVRINLTIDGTVLSAYYATQVLLPLDPSPELAANYGFGTTYTDCNLIVDQFGLATIVMGNQSITGNVSYRQNGFDVIGKFNGSVYNLAATVVSDGIIFVECYGAVNFVDYFTTGVKTAVSNGQSVLTKLTVNGTDTYVWQASVAEMPQIVTVQILSDNVLQFTSNKGVIYVKTAEWGNTQNGLILSDGLRGEYSKESDKLMLDGFGTAKVNGSNATYTVNANKSVTVVYSGGILVADVDVSTGTYSLSNIALDNSLLQGKTFTANYRFACGKASCSAATTIVFGKDGKAVVSSVSSDHDDFCEEHQQYEAPFAADNATYVVNGNKVTVTVKNYTVVLLITDVTTAAQLSVISTTVEKEAMGYFGEGILFVAA